LARELREPRGPRAEQAPRVPARVGPRRCTPKNGQPGRRGLRMHPSPVDELASWSYLPIDDEVIGLDRLPAVKRQSQKIPDYMAITYSLSPNIKAALK